MSRKYKLVQDIDEDGPRSSIKRHMTLASLIVVVPIAALVILTVISAFAGMRQRAVIENERAATAMTRTARAALPTRTPRSPSGPPTIDHDTALRSGPAMRFDSIRILKKGEIITPVGRDKTSNWLILDNGFWVADIAVIDEPYDLPIEPR